MRDVAPRFERVLVAGVGLIGGSLGLALRRRGLAGEVVGTGRSGANLEIARERGAIDRYEHDLATAARGADLVVLAVPVRSLASVAAEVVRTARTDALVVDAGSVKAPVVRSIEALVRAPAAFVGCHPIAGGEESGAAAAVAELFEGKWCILTPTARTEPAAVARARTLWEGVGMRVETMPPELHDRLFALVSHLPHVVAYALIEAIASSPVDLEGDPLRFSGGGLRDTTRIAASDAVMWRDIFVANRGEVLAAIDAFEAVLRDLRERIEAGDEEGLASALERCRAARRRIPRDERSA